MLTPPSCYSSIYAAQVNFQGVVYTDCLSCERMTKAETKIEGLEALTSGMDTKVDNLTLEVAKTKNVLVLLNIISPITVGLIVYLLTGK